MSKYLPARRGALRDEVLTNLDSFIDSMFQDAFPALNSDIRRQFFEKGAYPKTDLISLDDKVIISAAVPGLQKKDISVEIDDHLVLTISGSSQQEMLYKDRYVQKEIKRSKFSRSFVLTDEFDIEFVNAECQDGILTITIPRKKIVESGPKVKKIEVQ